MIFAKAFAGTLIAFLVIDILWIVRVVRPMYHRELGGLLRDDPRLGAAAAFYVLYAAGKLRARIAFGRPLGGRHAPIEWWRATTAVAGRF